MLSIELDIYWTLTKFRVPVTIRLSKDALEQVKRTDLHYAGLWGGGLGPLHCSVVLTQA